MAFSVKKKAATLHGWLRCGQVEGHGRVLEMPLVRAVAERLLGAQPAAADAYALAAAEAVGVALGINELDILAFYA